MRRNKLNRLCTFMLVTVLCVLIISANFMDTAQGSKKRRRRMRREAAELADANKKIGTVGTALQIVGGLLGLAPVVVAGNILSQANEISLLAANLMRLLSNFVFCDVPEELASNPPDSIPTIRSIIAEGLVLLPQNITHAPPGAILSIYGEDFDPNPTANNVTFSSEKAIVSLSNSTWLRVAVPYNITGPVNITVTTSFGTSPPFTFTVDPLATPPEPTGATSSQFFVKHQQILPLIKTEVEKIWLEEPEAFAASGVDKIELINYIDTEISLISLFLAENFTNLPEVALYKMDAIIVAWPPDILAEMDALIAELREYDWPMLGHDPSHTRYSYSIGPTTNQTPMDLYNRWFHAFFSCCC